jgi:hypothetical protein
MVILLFNLADLLQDSRLVAFNRMLLKLSEHTWGLDVKTFLADWNVWSNAAFHASLTLKNFSTMVNSWIEQRYFLTAAIQSLQDHPLAAQITNELKKFQNISSPDTSDYHAVSSHKLQSTY